MPYPHVRAHDVAPPSGLSSANNTWANSSRTYNANTLTAPSGFVSNGIAPHASLRRPFDDRRLDGGQEEGPPRKRMNRGPSPSPSGIMDSPGSPDIQRPGQKRRAVVNHSIESHSTSSDESIPDVANMFAESSKPRIVRGRASDTPDSTNRPPTSDSASEAKFISFKMTMPTESNTRCRAAWQLTNGDVRKATELLLDPHWVPTPVPLASKPSNEITGRVKEIDEQTKAQRAAVKEKGKKSAIYAHRPVLEAKAQRPVTPPVSKAAIDLTASSPITPEIAAPRRKRIKKMVVDSESELELTDSDEEPAPKRGKQENMDIIRALEYFNSTDSEALQQLTGTFLITFAVAVSYNLYPGCTPEQANTIIGLRPFDSTEDLNVKLGQGKKKAGPAGISSRMFEECTKIFKGYGAVDSILEDCEQIGATLRTAIAAWTTTPSKGKGKHKENTTSADLAGLDEVEDGALSLRSIEPLKDQKPKDFLTTQPSLLSSDVVLKEYQLLGVNWLRLLYRSKLSCILADEMGEDRFRYH